MTNYEKLQAVLREIFEMDKADLDFGIYRIINQKRESIEKFIEERLPNEIREILNATSTKDSISLEKEKEELGKSLDAAGVARESSPKYNDLIKLIEGAVDLNAMEQEIFSHLTAFFKRYYKEGDFISLRRYKKDVYAIPYEGEEVKLHWANHDQYYIKTSEYLKNYSFKTKKGKMVHFRLKEASTEQNNNMAQGDQERRFAVYSELPVEQDGNDLYINFTYEPHNRTVRQADLEKEAVQIIGKNIPLDFADIFISGSAATEKNKNRTLFEKHLNDYISKNTFDYFIHKDLGGFLNRELDFYIKNEVLYIDDIDTENPELFLARVSQVKALKTVGRKIISFVAQLEDFQKKLWLKKKFVIRTDYCITLDRISEEYYPEIFENKEQLAAWKELYDVNIKKAKDLENEPFLMLDTKFFDEDFKDKLLSEFDDLDAQTDGVLINSENFQALNLIKEKYSKEIDSIYIDPPYNTSEESFVYKNLFKHSSWLTMMENRLYMSYFLLNKSGVIISAIDDEQLYENKLLLDYIFQADNFIANLILQTNPRGRGINSYFATSHDYLLYYGKNISNVIIENQPLTEEQKLDFKYKDSESEYRLLPFRRSGGLSTPDERPNSEFSIFYNKKTRNIIGVGGERIHGYPSEYETKEVFIIENEEITKVELDSFINRFGDDLIIINPIDTEGKRRVWRWSDREKILNGVAKGDFIVNENNGFNIQLKDRIKDGRKPKTIWFDSKYDASSHGTILLDNILGSSKIFGYPKSVFNVLDSLYSIVGKKLNSVTIDYFAGSGTTGHAIIKLNRGDDGKRKYIMAEMGTYFNTVTKPRMQKVVYSDNWKNGKPQDKLGISHMFKYQLLESYEDSLNNLELESKNTGLLGFDEHAQEEYLLKYMLDMESREHLFNLEIFKNPFDYRLKVTENNELIPTKVDLVETFNYLIGLYVYRIQKVGDIKLIEGTTRAGEKTLVIWRNTETVTNDEVQKVFRKLYDSPFTHEFDQIYINGDHNFQNFRKEGDRFKVKLIEEDFFKKMFEEQ